MYFALQVLEESAEWTVPGSMVWHENVKLTGARTKLTATAPMRTHGLTTALEFWCCELLAFLFLCKEGLLQF